MFGVVRPVGTHQRQVVTVFRVIAAFAHRRGIVELLPLTSIFFITLYNFFFESSRRSRSVKSLMLLDILVEPGGVEPPTS